MKENTPGHRVETVWAFISVDADGDEGVCAFAPEPGLMMPMVASDQRRVDLLRPYAERVARYTGMEVRLVQFGGPRIELEVFK